MDSTQNHTLTLETNKCQCISPAVNAIYHICMNACQFTSTSWSDPGQQTITIMFAYIECNYRICQMYHDRRIPPILPARCTWRSMVWKKHLPVLLVIGIVRRVRLTRWRPGLHHWPLTRGTRFGLSPHDHSCKRVKLGLPESFRRI